MLRDYQRQCLGAIAELRRPAAGMVDLFQVIFSGRTAPEH